MKRPRMRRASPSRPPIVPRVFAVLAAVLLVGSVALASLLPSDTSLAEIIRRLDDTVLDHLQRQVGAGAGRAVWNAMVVPMLVRPVWLMPVCLGLICIGGALTALSHTSRRTKQRRS